MIQLRQHVILHKHDKGRSHFLYNDAGYEDHLPQIKMINLVASTTPNAKAIAPVTKTQTQMRPYRLHESGRRKAV